MASNQVVQTTLQWVVDKNSIAQVQSANAQVVQGLQVAAQQLETALPLPFIDASEASKGFAESIDQSIIPVEELASQTVAAGDAAKQASQQYQDMAKSAQNAADSGGGIGAGGLRSGLRAGGFLLGAEAGGGGLRAAGQIITLTSSFGLLGAAAGVGALALRTVTDQEQKASEASKQFASDLAGIAGQIGSGATSSAIKNNIQQLETQRKVEQDAHNRFAAISKEYYALLTDGTATAEKYNAGIAAINQQLADLTGGQIQLSGRSSLDMSIFQSALDDSQKEVDKTSTHIGVLNSELGATEVAANDAAEALAKEAKSQLSAVELIQKADNMTAEQRAERERAIQREISLNTEALNSHTLDYEAGLQVLQNNRDLRKEYESLIGVSNTYADVLKAEADEKDRINAATTNYFDALTKQGEAAQVVAKAQQDLAGSTQEHQDQLLQINQDEQQKEIDDRQKAAKTVEQDTQKHLDKVQEIEDQYNQDHEAAVGNRDALANYKAKQQEDKSLSKEQATFSAQEAQQQVHLTEQLKADQSAQAKAIAGENSSYTKRYNQLLNSLQNAQVAESRAAGLSAAYQSQANQNRLVMEVNHQNAVLGQVQVGLNLVEAAYRQHFANLSGIAIAAAPTPFQNSINIGQAFNAQINSAVNQQITRVVRGATQYR